MGDGYHQGNFIQQQDADNYGANWTADELELLRDQWRRLSLTELAERLGRTESACQSQYYHQLNRPLEQRWQPAEREVRPWLNSRDVQDTRPVRIQEDEEAWWDPDFYRQRPAI